MRTIIGTLLALAILAVATADAASPRDVRDSSLALFDRRCSKFQVVSDTAGGTHSTVLPDLTWTIQAFDSANQNIVHNQRGEWVPDPNTPDVLSWCFQPANKQPGLFRFRLWTGLDLDNLFDFWPELGFAQGATPTGVPPSFITSLEQRFTGGAGVNINTNLLHIEEMAFGECVAIGLVIVGADTVETRAFSFFAEQLNCRDEDEQTP